MNLTKKRELIHDEKRLIEWRIGYSICTVYTLTTKRTIKLQNFGYCPSDKNFYYTYNVHLPKEVINYFNGAECNEANIKKMEELGIYNGNDIDRLINIYEQAKKEAVASKIQLEIERQKVLDFRRTLKNR